MKHFLAIALICITLFGCNTNETSCGQAYFGGEIINPTIDYLVIYDNTAAIDTLYLDENNRFSKKIENLNSGLYSFTHGGEYQVLFLEPNDSILLRLNTLDFDESIVFTGKGSKKNNYLINLFVTLESEDKDLYELNRLEPWEFQSKLDSLKQNKHDKLDSFIEEHPTSKLYSKVAKATIDYSYYANKELYPFRHYGNFNKIDYNSLPTDFYAFRKSIGYNDDDLKDFYPYYNFLFHHFDNLALDRYFKTSKDSVFNRNSVEYNLNKLQLIDSLVGNSTIKNNLLKYTTRNFLSYCNSSQESEVICKSYLAKSTNEEHSEYITSLNNSLKKLHSGNKFPEVEISNYKNEVVNINTIINKPTIVYFWSKVHKNHFLSSHERVKAFKEAYPNINFVSINIDPNSSNMWVKLLKQNKFKLDHEYTFRDMEAAKKILAIHYINKVMVVNSNKEIVTSNANMFSMDFIEILDNLK